MATSDQTLEAFDEVRGEKKPENVGLGEWIWGALQGDFNQERSVGQIGFDMAVSLIPIVDTVLDVRDLCANINQYRKDPTNKITAFFLATTVVGFFPEFGTVVKSTLRIVWVYLKPLIRVADDITNISKLTHAATRAAEAALPKITEYLQHNRVAEWATRGKLADMYRFVARIILEGVEKISPELLSRLLDEKCKDMTSLLLKIRPIVPTTIREQLDDLLRFIRTKQRDLSSLIQEFAQPVRTVLKVVAKKLDDHAWQVEIYRTNRGWIGPMSESGSATLINAAPPAWVKKLDRNMPHPSLKMSPEEIRALLEAHPAHPKISADTIRTFSTNGRVRADHITGPAKLYRVIDPSNEGAGMFWMTEAEFKEIKDRGDWRSRFAVKPEWNQNGWFVEYEIKAGETVPVWRGPAASQMLDGTDYYLAGGAEQIVFCPANRDRMVEASARIDSTSGRAITDGAGRPDTRVEFTDVTGQTIPSKLRAEIVDPHIKGPLETGWGASDHTPAEAKRILLSVPKT